VELGRRTELRTEKFIKVNFIYDPNFIPYWYDQGKIDYLAPEAEYNPNVYAKIVKEEWENTISPRTSPVIHRTLGLNFFPLDSLTCYILEYRIQVEDGLFLEAHSNPLAIWAKPADPNWDHLPFHARVIHELSHRLGPAYSPNWDILEDRVWESNRDNPEFWSNRSQKEELVVRHVTHLITKEAFGEEFADWFLKEESKITPQ